MRQEQELDKGLTLPLCRRAKLVGTNLAAVDAKNTCVRRPFTLVARTCACPSLSPKVVEMSRPDAQAAAKKMYDQQVRGSVDVTDETSYDTSEILGRCFVAL